MKIPGSGGTRVQSGRVGCGNTEVGDEILSIIRVGGDSNTCQANPKYAGRLTVVPDYSRSIADVADAVFNCFPIFCCDITEVTGDVANLWFIFSCVIYWR